MNHLQTNSANNHCPMTRISSFLKSNIIISLLMGILLTAEGLSAGPLVVGTIWFPPFYNIEKDGDRVTGISGINVDIVTKVLDAIGEPYVLKYYPAKRLYANMIKGTTHLFYGIRVPESHISPEYIIHSRNTISKITLRAFHLETTPTINTRTDLIGKSVIVFRGYGYGGFIEFVKSPEAKMTIHTADTQVNGLKMLKKGRADYLIAFERPALAAMKTFPDGTLDDVTFSEPLYVADGYFVLSRKLPDVESLLSRMEKAYERLEAEGAFEGMIVY